MGEDQYCHSQKWAENGAPRSRQGRTFCRRPLSETGSASLCRHREPDKYWFPGIARFLEPGKNRRVDQRKGGGVNLRSFMYDETGQGLVEYALIIAVIAVAVIVAMLFLQDQLTNVFTNIGNNLT